MCLQITKDTKRQRATKDIVCYKIVEGDSLENIHTYYQRIDIKIGDTYKSFLKKESVISIKIGLHSLKSLKKTIQYINKYWKDWKWEGYDIYVTKCIIPKDSYYYIGTFDEFDKLVSYASNSIKYVKFIKNPMKTKV